MVVDIDAKKRKVADSRPAGCHSAVSLVFLLWQRCVVLRQRPSGSVSDSRGYYGTVRVVYCVSEPRSETGRQACCLFEAQLTRKLWKNGSRQRYTDKAPELS
jgi:hypothetical protein